MHIKKRLPKSAPVPSTVKASRESKNTFRDRNHWRGYQAEALVCQFLQKNGYRCLQSRWKTPYAEIDLLVTKADKYFLVEVKTLSQRDLIETRVSLRQKQRLYRARLWVEAKSCRQTGLILAFVTAKNEIVLFNEI